MTAAAHLAETADPSIRDTKIMVDVGDGALQVVRSGAGPRAILLHGWTLDHRMWQPQLPLSGDFELIMPDRRGFGRSTAPPNLMREAEDIAILAGDYRVALIGLSQGAAVALDFAVRNPDRVSALVLAGTPLPDLVPDEVDAVPRAEFTQMAANGRLDQMKTQWRAHKLTQVNQRAQPLLDAMLGDYQGRDLIAVGPQLSINAEAVAKLPMPVLALAGASDTDWRRQVAQTIAATAPCGQAAEIVDAGHLCNLDNPSRFNALVREFLTSTLH